MLSKLPPGAGHALVALGIQAFSALVMWLLLTWLTGLALLLAAGGWCAVVFYASRERRQAEEAAGSDRIPPWQWLPRSARDIAWPALVVASVTSIAAWVG